MIANRTVVLLIRHGHTDAIGVRLVSRLPGLQLSAAGRGDAARVRAALAAERLAAVYSSPLERAIETAQPLAAEHRLRLRHCGGLVEVDFGEWTGKTFRELDQREDWRRFNARRGSAVVPRGERASAVQARVVACLRSLQERHPGETVAAVSHADVIRAALLHYADIPLDRWHEIDVEPGSISAVALGSSGGEVLYMNHCPCGSCA